MMKTVLAILLLAVSASACEQYFRSCTDSDALASDVTFTFDPEWSTLKKGDSYTLTTEYYLSEEVTSGIQTDYGTLSGIKVVDQSEDLCKELAGTENECPLPQGGTSYETEATLDSSLPDGTLYGKSTWQTSDGRQILCYESVLCL